MIRISLLALGICHFLAPDSFGYGASGHEAIGRVAEFYLKGSRAETEVRALLKGNEDLARAATWADRAKIPDKYLANEMKEFVANNPLHHEFHYCDVPFQEKAYRDGLVGTNDHDLIHTMRACIKVLQSPDDAADNPLKISKRVAFMLLTHYIGDLHQPLHVGSSYVDENDKFVNPRTGAKGLPDAGSNFFRITAKSTLHAYWDTMTVKLARDKAGEKDFTAYLVENFPVKPEWNATGDITTWPEQWATGTLLLAPQCFEGLTLGKRFLVPKDEKHEEHYEWPATLAEGYKEKARDIVEQELAKSGYRLAALLKAIWPEK